MNVDTGRARVAARQPRAGRGDGGQVDGRRREYDPVEDRRQLRRAGDR